MMQWYVLDSDHGAHPATLEEYSAWSRTGSFEERKIVAKTNAEGIEVSTVFLGLDHGMWGGTPLLFETMVFAEGIEELDQHCERYATWGDAERGHEQVVRYVNDTLALRMRARVTDRLLLNKGDEA